MRRVFILALFTSLFVVACQRGADSPTASPQTIPVTIVSAGDNPEASAPPTGADQAQPTQHPIPTTSYTPAPSPTPFASAMPLPTPRTPLIEPYVVQWGDTLGGISLAFDVPLPDLVALNGLGAEDAIIHIGQTLQVPINVSRSAAAVSLLPDSEVVYSPAYVGFDVGAFVGGQGGYLAEFSAPVDDVWLSGAEIVERVARQYSVGPRVLLALLEHYGGWVTQPQPRTYQPLGPANPYYDESFLLQLSWAANRVNGGYYRYKRDGHIAVQFSGGGRAMVAAGLNAGSAGIYDLLAINGDWETWDAQRRAFMEAYRRLFGDPFALAVEPLVPANLTQPTLGLPWQPGEIFYYTGGPHAAYGSRSAWAAVDFAPPDIKGNCYYSAKNITAAADGRILMGETGEVYLDLDGDGNLQTGWVLLYLHTVTRDELSQGQLVSAGTPIGYASCEGGISNSSHLHLARRFNGEWMAADGPVPLVLSGWQFSAGAAQYDGGAKRGGVIKTACECWDDVMNALTAE